MSDTDSNEIAEGLRRWLDQGNLDAPSAVYETINLAELKRRAAQRILTAQRSRHDA